MQKVQILSGVPNPTYQVVVTDVAQQLALNAIYKRNLIVNGSMLLDASWANYGSPAVNAQSTTKLYRGTQSRKLTPNAANEGMQGDVFPTVTGEKYRYTIPVYPDDGTVVSIIIRKGDDSGDLFTETVTGLTENAWNVIHREVVEQAGGAGAYLVLHSGAQTSGDFYFSDIFASKVVRGGSHDLVRRALRAYITVETHDVRYAFGGTVPTPDAGTGLGHLVADPAIITLQNFDQISSFRFINDVAQSAGNLQVTTEF
ncbi:hypothetical protein LCGC14_0600740 [marine sediment metagenome]|uniref:Uncharacterized protein n=1 Tax=marine sediment metagenome TaxID=412755 RepID=A0A0F9UJ13_9ZZZZ